MCSPGECQTPSCPRDKCSEAKYGTPWTADKHFAKGGAFRIDGVAKIQAEIMANGPVSASFTVFNDFLTYRSGVYTHVTGADLGGHAVKIYGWGTDATGADYWMVANSWNNEVRGCGCCTWRVTSWSAALSPRSRHSFPLPPLPIFELTHPLPFFQQWGMNGSFLIARGNDECGIESDVVAGNA